MKVLVVGGGGREDGGVLVAAGACGAGRGGVEGDQVGAVAHGDRAGIVVPEAGVAVGRGSAEELARRPVPTLAGGESLVQLDGPHLLEQVDDGVAVGAEGQRAARVVQAAARADAVAEVALGRRAEARGHAGGAEPLDVEVGEVGGMHGAGAVVEHTGLAFKTYMVWRRLFRALEAYAEGSTLTEAAHHAGFADSAHFSRVFRRYFGMPATTLTRV